MPYNPENNPYIPGDPYSYDLKWVVAEINHALELYTPLHDEFVELSGEFSALHDYVMNYFAQLDLTEEVRAGLDAMAADGTLDALIQPYFNAYKAEISGEIAVLTARMDAFSSLTDASTTGDAELQDIRVGANGVTYPTAGDAVRAQVDDLQDQIDIIEGVNPPDLYSGITPTINDGYAAYQKDLPAGTYTLSFKITSTNPSPLGHVALLRTLSYNAANVITSKLATRDRLQFVVFKITEPMRSIYMFSGATAAQSSGYACTPSDVHLYSGIYIPADTPADMTDAMQNALTENGVLELKPGTYRVNNLIMDDDSKLTGDGAATKVYVMPDHTNEYEMSEPLTTATQGYMRAWQYSAMNNNVKFAAGLYRITLNVDTTYSGDVSRVNILDQGVFAASHIITHYDIPRGETVSFTIYVNDRIGSVYVMAGTGASYTNVPLTINSFKIEREQAGIIMGSKCSIDSIDIAGAETPITIADTYGHGHGVVWAGDDTVKPHYGHLTNCSLHDFDGGAIAMLDTGTPVDNSLTISDCYLYNNNRGIFNMRDSEYNNIDNCSITRNWYGAIIRGGNNNISNCGIDGNVLGISIDSDEGSNGGHGAITNCSINHSNSNTGYGMIITGAGLEIVSNCNFYYSKVRIDDTQGNILTGCAFGTNGKIEISQGNCSIINGCMFRDSNPITIYDNDAAKIVNCFRRSGAAITPVISPTPI